MNLLDELPRGARVALIRLRSLGDCVLLTPAIRLLKAARSDLQIAVITDERWAAVFEGNPDCETLLPAQLRAWRPKLAVNLHGGGTSARLTALSGARWRAAWKHFRWQFLYNVHIPTAQQVLNVNRTVHTAEHAASAMFALGVPVQSVPRARLFTTPGPWRAPYAVIHPFASEPAKIWPAENFRAAAEFLRSEAHLEPIFLGAPADDLSAFTGYTLAQGQSLAETKSLISGAALFLGNDSGPAHIAAAFGIPATVLFGPSNPEIWGSWQTEASVLQSTPLADLTVDRVLAALPLGVRA